MYQELYAGEDSVALDALDDAPERLGIPDIDMHAARIRRGLHADPAQAIGSAKELLETTLKAILGLHGTGPETKLEIPQLVKRVGIELGLDASTVSERSPEPPSGAKSWDHWLRSSTARPSCVTPASARATV